MSPNRSSVRLGGSAPGLDAATESRLRLDYFSHGGGPGIRYGVSVDRLVAHVAHAMQRRAVVSPLSLRHVADMVHAAGCVDGSSLAWADLHERHEAGLIRCCGLDEQTGTLAVRQLLARLRHRTQRDERLSEGEVSLRDYLGRPSLRHWLAAVVRRFDGPVVSTPPFLCFRRGKSAIR
jgi:hypothetical protein